MIFWEEIYPNVVNVIMQLDKDRGPYIVGFDTTLRMRITGLLIHMSSQALFL